MSLRGSIIADDEVPATDGLSFAGLRNLDLHDFWIQQPNLDVQRLQSLRKLSLGTCLAGICDFSRCTQVTSLAVTLGMPISGQVLLPAGSNVQLQHLSVSGEHEAPIYFQELHNLQDATKFTSIEFDEILLADLNERG